MSEQKSRASGNYCARLTRVKGLVIGPECKKQYQNLPEQEFLLEQTRVLLEQVRPGAVGADPAAVVTAGNST